MINSTHYPSLDRCKHLKELGFPETEYVWGQYSSKKPPYPENHRILMYQNIQTVLNVCPSVMEMLDVIPKKLTLIEEWNEKYEYGFLISKTNSGNFRVVLKVEFIGTLPNALADLIIWLVENSHLNFKSHGK